MAKALCNICTISRESEWSGQIHVFIDYFVDFYQKYPGRKQAFLLALSLCDTCQYFSEIGQLDKIDVYSRQLAQLYTEYPDSTAILRAKALAGACLRFSICYKNEKMREYLSQLKDIYLCNNENLHIAARYIGGLISASSYYRKKDRLELMQNYLREALSVNSRFSTTRKDVVVYLAEELSYACITLAKSNALQIIQEEYLGQLIDFHLIHVMMVHSDNLILIVLPAIQPHGIRSYKAVQVQRVLHAIRLLDFVSTYPILLFIILILDAINLGILMDSINRLNQCIIKEAE